MIRRYIVEEVVQHRFDVEDNVVRVIEEELQHREEDETSVELPGFGVGRRVSRSCTTSM